MNLTKVTLPILCILFSQTIFAQTEDEEIDLNGRYALQFQVTDLLQFTDFQGGVISGKYHFNENFALRFGTEIDLSNADRTTENKQINPASEVEQTLQEDQFNIGIHLQLLFLHDVSSPNIFLYYGGGPFIGYYSETNERESQSGELLTNYKSERTSKSYGVNAVLGVEWFFMKSMSLSLEYNTGIALNKSDINENNDGVKSSRTEEIFNIRTNQVKLGLSILL